MKNANTTDLSNTFVDDDLSGFSDVFAVLDTQAAQADIDSDSADLSDFSDMFAVLDTQAAQA